MNRDSNGLTRLLLFDLNVIAFDVIGCQPGEVGVSEIGVTANGTPLFYNSFTLFPG